jgi:small subunit ribosomal protein S18
MTTEEAAPRSQGQERPKFRKYGGRRKVCRVCYKGSCVGDAYKVDYKDVGKLRMFVNDRGKIEPRRKTGSCARGQRAVAVAVKRARHLALLPYTLEHVTTSRVFPTRR